MRTWRFVISFILLTGLLVAKPTYTSVGGASNPPPLVTLGTGLALTEAVALTGDVVLVKAKPMVVGVVPRGSHIELAASRSFDG